MQEGGPRPDRVSLGGRNDQSALTPANLTTLPHLSVSSAMNFPNSRAEVGNAVLPRSAKRACITGLASATLISLLSLLMMSAGVFRTSGTRADDEPYRPRRIALRPCGARHGRESSGTCGKMQELPSVGEFHGAPPDEGAARDRPQ